MTRFGRWAKTPSSAPRLVVWMFAGSAVVACIGLVAAVLFAQADANASDARIECRSKISNYVEGLKIELDVSQAMGLLDKVGATDLPIPFDAAVTRASFAASRLEIARPYREQSVAICQADPSFDPLTDITPDGPPKEP